MEVAENVFTSSPCFTLHCFYVFFFLTPLPSIHHSLIYILGLAALCYTNSYPLHYYGISFFIYAFVM